MMHLEGGKFNEKETEKNRLIRAGIQLLFFIFAPALFSTAFAGVKSIFQAIAAHQTISWNSFLDVTAVLLVVTCLFGRHFCGYACAFGSLGDALYELTVFIRQKVFHKKGRHGYSEKAIRILQKVKYIWLLVLLVSILTGWYSKLQGMSPWDVFSMLTAGRLPGAAYKVGIVLADSAHDRNVHSGKIFLPVPLPNGRDFCYNAYSTLCTVQP